MNLPNKLSMIRIFLIPVMIFFYLADFVPFGKVIAIVVFILAAFTDFLDGKIARKYNLVTNLGKLLDPIADKLLVISALLLVVIDQTIPAPYGVIIAIIIIGRELLISAFRQIAATKNVVMAADMFGKIKTFTQDIALPLLFLYSFLARANFAVNDTLLLIIQIFSFVAIGLATVFTVLSGINYMVKNKNVLKD
ncbi:MAG: CDP-diacylglycerol--glycerol-3-phosphate 3-phosphatidyltransferase [Clostridiales bacterium]|nr:CDP-diacylglycerol--glycerol-3-phosphate 3-phosphatidyltransferase [Clostridiales bacterium]